MANLSVDEANFLSERAVVEEEYRQSILSRPYGRLGLYESQVSFAAHPYKRNVIGSIADLDSATLEDVQKFHAHQHFIDPITQRSLWPGTLNPLNWMRGWINILVAFQNRPLRFPASRLLNRHARMKPVTTPPARTSHCPPTRSPTFFRPAEAATRTHCESQKFFWGAANPRG